MCTIRVSCDSTVDVISRRMRKEQIRRRIDLKFSNS